jgi:hypothetical protein
MHDADPTAAHDDSHWRALRSKWAEGTPEGTPTHNPLKFHLIHPHQKECYVPKFVIAAAPAVFLSLSKPAERPTKPGPC